MTPDQQTDGAKRSTPFPDPIPAEQIYLAQSPLREEWSLWQRSHDRLVDRMLIGWAGVVNEPPHETDTPWDMTAYRAYSVPPEDVPAFEMAARHLDTEQWRDFAARYVERKQSRQII